MKPMLANSNEFVSAYERITHAAKPYFARVAKKPLGSLEERYPHTVQALFETALQLSAENPYAALSPGLSETKLMELLNLEKGTEAADHKFHHTGISEVDLAGLQQLFHDFVLNLSLPSYTTVEILLERGRTERAFSEALKLSHEHDKTKALRKLVAYHLNQGSAEKAIELFGLLPESVDKRDTISDILNFLLSSDQYHKALSMANSLIDNGLRMHALHVIALWLTKQAQWKMALKLLHENMLEDSEYKAYTLSLMVLNLVVQGKFKEAIHIAASITEKDYHQDANQAIVKGLVRRRLMQEAAVYVHQIADVLEKKEAHKIIESAQKTRLREEKIHKLQRFL